MKSSDAPEAFINIPVLDYQLTEALEGPPVRRKKVATKEIGALSRYHYSFMGAISPEELRPAAEQLSKNLLAEGIDAVILVPI